MKYYVSSGFVGNCMLWWRKDGHGYSCDLLQAEIFNDTDPQLQTIAKDKKYRIWEKDYILSCASSHVDSEKLDTNKSGIQ
jgi:hypothetical protein